MLTPTLLFVLLPGAALPAVAPPEQADRAPLIAPRPARRTASAERIAAAIADLGADDWARREAASRLLESAPGAAEALREAATDADLERRTRALAALAEGLRLGVRRGDTRAAGEFNVALKALRDAPLLAPDAEPDSDNEDGSDNGDGPEATAPPAIRAETAAAADAALRLFPRALTKVAVAEVRRLGGVAKPHDPFGRGRGFGAGIGGSTLSWSVTLDDRWAGGEEGLTHLRSIARLTQVYLVDDCPLPDDARDDLHAGRYGLFRVERRGRAYLGVQFDSSGAGGCEIRDCEPGGPAARAGLRRHDVIVKFGDAPILTSASLLDAIREEGKVGEATPVTIVRPGRGEMVLPVTLSRWTDGPVNPRNAPNAPLPGWPFRPQPLPGLAPPRAPVVPEPDDPPPAPGVPDLDEETPEQEDEGDEPPEPRVSRPPFTPDRPAPRIPGNGDPIDLGDTPD